MIAYHGSNVDFEEFKIDINLLNNQSSLANEGLGIYFTTDINIAKSYGKFIYVIEIQDESLYDFRDEKIVTAIINDIIKTNPIIKNQFDKDLLIYRILDGIQTISEMDREIILCLESNYEFYEKYENQFNSLQNNIRSQLEKYTKAYLFNYHIKNIGIIKDLSTVKIIKKDYAKNFLT